MLKVILIIFTVLTINFQLSTINFVLAQTSTPAKGGATPTPDKNVTELKERIATQVARLNIIKKRGILGSSSDVSNSQLVIVDIKGNKRFVDVDELTKFEDLKAGISDLKKDDSVQVLGLYNTESKRMLARFIKKSTRLERLVGEVQDLDDKNFIVEVVLQDATDTKVIEIEKTTKIQELEKGEILKSGFSKIRIGEKIIAVGFTKDNVLQANRILLLPELSPNIKIP